MAWRLWLGMGTPRLELGMGRRMGLLWLGMGLGRMGLGFRVGLGVGRLGYRLVSVLGLATVLLQSLGLWI